MYSNILVPVALDHREEARAALAIAKVLLADNGKITLMHVVEDVPGYAKMSLPEGTFEKNRDFAYKELREISDNDPAKPEVAVTLGHASRTILDYTEQHGCDCIVVASHRPGLEDYFLGSTAAWVVRHAPCAVHVLR